MTEVDVANTAAVPITVTSHFHFFEVNPRLAFDREAAYGRHLDVAAGSEHAVPARQDRARCDWCRSAASAW